MDVKAWDAVAVDYFEEVISPFQKGVANPLYAKLDRLARGGGKTVADLGCGIGNLLPFLAPRFKCVHAVDFSPAMLRESRRHRFSNIKRLRLSLVDLKPLYSKVDVAVAVNSILAPSCREVNAMLVEVRRTLRTGGRFLGVFPAMESVLHQGQLILERELQSGISERQAVRNTHRIFEEHKYSFLAGIFDEVDASQKLYYSFELHRRLKEAGFRAPRLAKVCYPWDAVGGHEAFPGRPPMWDWFVQARV
ncbi:MAG: hypothetical protein AMXMBFR7_34690 [Planctomycetota bacterium]